jgi:hypothetical protein
VPQPVERPVPPKVEREVAPAVDAAREAPAQPVPKLERVVPPKASLHRCLLGAAVTNDLRKRRRCRSASS